MSKLIEKWNSISMTKKWWALAFVQTWVWPQMFDAKTPAGIGLSLFITMVGCMIFNAAKLIASYGND